MVKLIWKIALKKNFLLKVSERFSKMALIFLSLQLLLYLTMIRLNEDKKSNVAEESVKLHGPRSRAYGPRLMGHKLRRLLYHKTSMVDTFFVMQKLAR